MNIELYADGSATTKDRPGGWGAVVLIDGVLHKELSGYLESATNNDAELAGAINGLSYVYDYVLAECFLNVKYSVTLISDSEIILNWANGSYRFKQEEKMGHYNRLRWLVTELNAGTKWVRGHSGNVWNERCDKLANKARKSQGKIDDLSSSTDTRIGTKKTGIVCLYYGDVLKIVDLASNIVEDYNRDLHGKRGSAIEIREEKREMRHIDELVMGSVANTDELTKKNQEVDARKDLPTDLFETEENLNLHSPEFLRQT